VVEEALRHPEVRDLATSGITFTPNQVERHLYTSVETGAELIRVTYESQASGRAAQTVLNAVLDTYYELYGEGGDTKRRRVLNALRLERDALRRQRTEARGKVNDFIRQSKWGSTNLETIRGMTVETISELNRDIQAVTMRIDSFEDQDDGEAPPVALGPREPSPQELERLAPDLVELRRQEIDLKSELEEARLQYTDPRHRVIRQIEAELRKLQSKIDNWEQIARDRFDALAASGGPAVTTMLMSRPELIAHRDRLKEQLVDYQEEMRQIAEEQVLANELTSGVRMLDERFEVIERRIDSFELESDPEQFAGAVTILERGEAASAPSKDRRKPMMAVGFAGGMGISFGLFFLLGTVDQRTFSASQLRQLQANIRVLGVLPDLRAKSVDAEVSETATQCVHQIRNRIEAMRSPTPSFVLLVTSPFSGDGKTSLAMALGWSYAAAGHRTLLVDCDFYGRSLTRQMGVADEKGLKEVLRDRRLNGQVVDMPVPNLAVLGTGIDADFGPESIRRDDFGSLCAELRQRFDVIIIDTGPLIGSVELLPVASASNGVVFSVRRGRSRARLNECVTDLESVHVPVLGVILNRADQADCRRYVSKSTRSVPDSGDDGDRYPRARRDNALVRAMDKKSESEER
jgi:Mrp family chromosome partitioning ATPase/uncharacterized protein involved in exopolysaccharide biosynthesis